MTLDECLTHALPASDSSEHYLRLLHTLCMEAHRRTPGVTLEVGTRAGGSALILAHAMFSVYGMGMSPPLITVDPYGNKPFRDGTGVYFTDYGLEHYLTAKRLLAGVGFHTHFRLMSRDYIAMVQAAQPLYWERGEFLPFAHLTFAFLDGEHDAHTIRDELTAVLGWLKPGGMVVIDNVELDPATLPMLAAWAGIRVRRDGPWAVVEPQQLQPGEKPVLYVGPPRADGMVDVFSFDGPIKRDWPAD